MNVDLIRNIIFDLGGVLLNINPEITGKALADLGVKDMRIVNDQLLADRVYYRFDSGQITPAEFREEIRKHCGIPLIDAQVDTAWNALLLDFPAERVKLLHDLKANYKVYLLSNTNSIHFESYTESFRRVYGEEMTELFHRLFLSYELGCHKPDKIIYEKVISLAQLNPKETLFIDDSGINLPEAVNTGLVALHLKAGMEVTAFFKNGKLRPEAEFLYSDTNANKG
ncbi:MAG: HAD family phosphatase [Bacteroidetes bacterium]|nr:HAD family phosphatase [Bacteroidota bacterium]